MIPNKFYKYLRSDDLHFLEKGSLLIRPLSYYRRPELPLAQRDPTESTIAAAFSGAVVENGITTMSHKGETRTFPTPPSGNIFGDNNPLSNSVVVSPDNRKKTVLGGGTTILSFDAYCYCVSSECSKEVAQSFNDQGCEYDACVEIQDMRLLIDIIGEKQLLFDSAFFGRCEYLSDKQIGPFDISPEPDVAVFQKPSTLNGVNYANQKEWRIVFFPMDGRTLPPLPPIIDPGIAKLFRRVDIPK